MRGYTPAFYARARQLLFTLRRGEAPGPALALALSLALNGALELMGIYGFSYDAYTHIFFADHYRRAWFSLWEPRWYGGFSVASYPPLCHQLLALLSFPLGLIPAYQLLATASAGLLTYSSYLFSKLFLGRQEGGWAALAAALLPSVGLTLNAFGQLPTILSSSLVLLAAYRLGAYLRGGGARPLLQAVLLLTLSGLAHHFTLLFFAPSALLLILIRFGGDLRRALREAALFMLLCAPLLLASLYPFISYMLSAPSWAEIPHASREQLFSSARASLPFFWGIYGFTALLLPNALALAYRKRELRALFALFLLYFLLGLGGTTPLPQLLFGPLWKLLTYDRFGFWATLLYAPFLGIMLKDGPTFVREYYLGLKGGGGSAGAPLRAAFIFGLALCFLLSSTGLALFGVAPTGPLNEQQLAQLASFLDQQGDYGYITLGLGNGRLLLSALTSAPTLDGGYNLAKSSPLLAKSGVESADAAKFFPNGYAFLSQLLANASRLGLRFVISADPSYDGLLRDAGFRLRGELMGAPPVSIWEIPEVAPLSSPSPAASAQGLLWGLVPPLLLVLLLGLLLHGPKARPAP